MRPPTRGAVFPATQSELPRPTIRIRRWFATTLLVAFTVVGCSSASQTFDMAEVAGSSTADFAFEISAGAGLALDAGNPLEILPAELRAEVGQSIEIVNVDDRGHLIGPWFVGAGETLRQEFTSPGEYIGTCTVHPSGEIRVIVESG